MDEERRKRILELEAEELARYKFLDDNNAIVFIAGNSTGHIGFQVLKITEGAPVEVMSGDDLVFKLPRDAINAAMEATR